MNSVNGIAGTEKGQAALSVDCFTAAVKFISAFAVSPQ